MSTDLTPDDLDRLRSLELEAQHAAERRLYSARETLVDDDAPGDGLIAPYCGCDTCDVREVIHAAWPALYKLAHDPAVEPPDGLEGLRSA